MLYEKEYPISAAGPKGIECTEIQYQENYDVIVQHKTNLDEVDA